MDNLQSLKNILMANNAKTAFMMEFENNDNFRNWILEILPEIETCRLQQQNNVWHIYNVLDHTLHAVEHINTLSSDLPQNERLLLATIMLLHDLGKPESNVKRLVDGKEFDSFPKHEIASAKIAKRALVHLGFSENENQIIEKLVLDHDFFMHLTRRPDFHTSKLDEVAKQKIKELSGFGDGFKLNEMLVFVSLADNMAQNPELTKNSIGLIKHYQNLSKHLKNTKIFE